MKKRLWMILVIVLVIMFVPRYNSHRSKTSQGQRPPHRSVPVENGDFEFPLPTKWLLMSILQENKFRRQSTVSKFLLASGTTYNRYKPAQKVYNPMI